MRAFMAAAIVGAFSVCAFAQVTGGTVPRRTYGSSHGFGNILYPGVGTAPNPTWGPNSTFSQRLGATVSGFPPYTGRLDVGRGRGRQGGFRGPHSGVFPVAVPYAVPVYVGGYGYGYGYSAQPPSVTYVIQAPQTPQVVINQHYTPDAAKPVVREYPQGMLPEPSRNEMRVYEAPGPGPAAARAADEEATIYLIALKDQTIHAAVAYWMDGNTLNYVTVQGSHNRATLDLVDRELSDRLNSQRNVEFNLTVTRQ